MTGVDRQVLLTKLASSRKLLMAALSGVSEAQWAFKPNAESYSIAQCVEHLAVTESGVVARVRGRIQKHAPEPSRWAEAAGKDDLVWRAMPQRRHKVKAPPEMQPTAGPPTPQAGIELFEKVRSETIAYVEATEDDVRSCFLPHVSLGTLDAWQWLLAMALHVERHVGQIEEIKKHPQFP